MVIVGAGAVGGTIGGLLAAAGQEVVLVARGAHGAALADRGLTLRTVDREVQLPLQVAGSPRDVDWRPDDLALVAVKLQDAAPALDDLRAAAGPDVAVVCAQNGLEGTRQAAARFTRVLGAVVWTPASHLGPGVVECFGEPAPGWLDLGAVTPGAAPLVEPVAAVLRTSNFVVETHADVAPLQRTKLLLNLGNVGQVLALDDARRHELVRAAVAEAEEVLRAAGLSYAPTEDFLAARAARVRSGRIHGRERGGGSTWQSHARGQPLETAFLNGEVVRLAASIGRDAPVNRKLVEASARTG
jgi:2-dehydropantoate 2-reductase